MKSKNKLPLYDFHVDNICEICDDNETISSLDEIINKDIVCRLKMSCDNLKKYYISIRSTLLNYDRFLHKHNSFYDVYYYKKNAVLKIAVYGLYLNIDIMVNDRLHNYKIYNDYDFEDLNDEINRLIKRYKCNKRKDVSCYINNINAYDLNATSREIISLYGYNLNSKLPKYVISNACILKRKESRNDKIVHEVSVGELSNVFGSKYKVTLDFLKMIELASSEANFLVVTPYGTCTEKVEVEADSYDEKALEAILLSGGNACLLV